MKIKVINCSKKINLEYAKNLLSLPKLIGKINDEEIYLEKKKYGFFITYKKKNYSIKNPNPFDIKISEIKKIIHTKD